MAGIPTSLAIAIWATGACWIVAILAYVFDVEAPIVAPLLIVGGLAGASEWCLRSRR